MDLISRQAVIDEISRLINEKHHIKIGTISFRDGVIDGYARVLSMVKSFPSAQPEPKKGKWVHDGLDFPHGVDWVHCSVCGKKGINVPADLTNFCPNCGADMRGEEV